MTDKTIVQVVKDGLCTGCGTCVALCPNEAIKLTINEKKGIYVPELSEEKCDNCGTCYEVCPGHEVDFKTLNLEIFGKEPEDILIGTYINCYIGHSTDYEIRYNSSSGGLVTQLLIFALDEGIIDGALVTKMSDENPLEPEVFIARTKEEIITASQSKFCPVPANIMLKKILKEKGMFAVVGLSCHIQGIRKAEMINKKLKEKIALHLGLCSCSTNINFLGTERVLQKMNIRKENVKKIDYRKGENPPGMMSIKLKDGNTKQITHTEFWIFSSPFFVPTRCTFCYDGTCELADISFGSWTSLRDDDTTGETVCVSRTKFGEELIQNAKSKKKIDINQISSIKGIRNKKYHNWKKKLIRSKKSNLKACIFLFKLLGKKVPSYNIELLKPKPITYLSAIWLYLCIYILSKRYLWSLLCRYIVLKRFLFRCAIYCFHKVKDIF